MTRNSVDIYQGARPVSCPVELIDWSPEEVKKGGFAHYMLKEIYEQPQAFFNTLRAIDKSSLPEFVCQSPFVTIVACGSSYHAGLIFKYLLEESCGVPARVDFASEFRYFLPPADGLVIGITQSGETADTLTALRKARIHNCRTLAITNVLGSSASRVADATLFMRAGPESASPPPNRLSPSWQFSCRSLMHARRACTRIFSCMRTRQSKRSS